MIWHQMLCLDRRKLQNVAIFGKTESLRIGTILPLSDGFLPSHWRSRIYAAAALVPGADRRRSRSAIKNCATAAGAFRPAVFSASGL